MMRAICLLLVSLFALKVNAQQYTKFNGYGFAADRMRSDSISIHPSDTVRNKAARSIAVLNGVFYIADGTKWKVVGTDTTSLSNRINLKLNIADTSSMLSPYSKLKSVGLTMPSAFSVANSPLTSDGTLAVSGAGTASQYVRGDGVLGDFPTATTGGGASVSYYLNGSVNKGTFGGQTYYEMSRTAIIGVGTDFTRTNAQGDGLIAQFITDTITNLLIPAGNWNLEFYFNASSGGSSPSFYVELYKYDGTTFTLISSNSTSPELIAFGTTINPYFSALAVPETILSGTDRLAIRVFVNTSGRTINLHTENSHLCQIITTFTTGLTAINGLTKQVQYFATGTSGTDFNISSSNDTHTFNLPSASTSARGLITTGTQTFAGAKTFNGGINLPNFIPINFTNGATVEGFNGKLVFRTVSGTAGYFENNSLYLAAMDNEPSTSNIGVMVKNFNSESKVGYKTPAQMMTYLGALGTTDTATMLNPYTRGSGTSGQIGYWNATRSLTGSSGFTFTPTSSLLVNNSVTAASAIARGTNLTPTLTAAANNDALVGLDINPTFNTGSFVNTNFTNIRAILGTTKTSSSFIINGFQLKTNDATQAQKLDISYIGNATASNRSYILQTSEEGIAFNGNITLQNQGGKVLIGSNNIFATTNTFEVTGASRFSSNVVFGTVGAGTGLIWDNTTNRLGIGVSTPNNKLSVVNNGNGIISQFTNNTDADFLINLTSGVSLLTTSVGALSLGATSTEGLRMFASTRNVLIQNGGTFTDAGFRLDVNGTARVQDILTVTTGTTKGINFAGTKIVEPTNASNFTQLLIQPNSGNKDAVFQFAPNGTSTASVMEFYHSSSLANTSRFIFKNINGVLQIGADGAALPVTFISNNVETARFATTGNLLINTTTDNASAILNVTSTTKGFLPPRMTTAQRDLIATPAAGLVIYNTSTNTHQGYNGTTWNNFY